jgi:hypothetical protein
MLSAKISGSFNVGGGIRYHTEYKLDVMRTQETGAGVSWSLYKRYSQFESLHRTVLELLGEVPIPIGSYLPLSYLYFYPCTPCTPCTPRTR